jgi:opacity protein-like surface antigen
MYHRGMKRALVACSVSLMAVALLHVTAAAEALDSLNLDAFAPFDSGDEVPYEPDYSVPGFDRTAVMQSPPSGRIGGMTSDRPARQFYLSSIVGGSFLVVTADNSPSSILTAGGAMGIAFDRPGGRVRVEAEGRYRDPIEQTYLGFNRETPRTGLDAPGPIPPKPELIGTMQAKSYGGWSAMANIWRDFQLTDRIDAYVGGGIGGAGFQTSFQQIDSAEPSPAVLEYRTAYAWQIGVGGIWNVNDRVAVDLSYRIFGLGWSITADDLAFGFLRSEVLLSLRIYEPFRGLLP